ncbi:LysR family transcriptional regulator [Novosphingobium aquiterrae]|uniref:LysR family transcriptional regulator n=1 Tax=Novosphingobium aquiterrae TaxID=624388 RepID=A0ABV6PNT3_9SPHN
MKPTQEFDLHAIEVFIMTVELGGMSQCALHLQITQSAVSQTIARLEANIGTPLFDRSMRPLGLTTSGRSLFERGKRLLALARSTYDDIRVGANLPLASLTLAMSFSLAYQLTATIMSNLGDRAERWNIRSGISQEHQGEFMARDIDVLMTGSYNLEHRDNVELHPVFEEGFVIVTPANYRKPLQIDVDNHELPFIRFSHLTGMGQQIERQIVRLKLNLRQVVEVESSHQQLALVAAGLGWTITSPICLLAAPELLRKTRIEPMPRGRFSRTVQVVSRVGELGTLPQDIAKVCANELREVTFPPLFEHIPWMKEQVSWHA